jgi:adenosylhomocysteinase
MMSYENIATTNNFVSAVLGGQETKIGKLVFVTHLAPGAYAFLAAVHKKIPIAAVIPKPNSIDTHVMDLVSRSIPILKFTRAKINANPHEFISDLKASVGGSSFVVIDTGGYFSHILNEMTKAFGPNFIGIVEDTENGHQKYENLLSAQRGIREFPCPIVSVARSALKQPEDFLVGQAIVFSAEALLREQGTILTGKRAAVLGYGKIGRSIAQNLHSKSARVDVVDTNPSRQVLALAQGFHTGNFAEVIGSADLIFCATGNMSLKHQHLGFIKHDAYVFTATSADDEIEDHLILMKNCVQHANGKIAQIELNGNRFFLCNNGNSVNFLHGGVVGEFIKLVQAELVFAAARLSESQNKARICEVSDVSKSFIADLWLKHFTS